MVKASCGSAKAIYYHDTVNVTAAMNRASNLDAHCKGVALKCKIHIQRALGC